MVHRLLIVDDEEPILFSMRRYLAAHGFEVDTAIELDEARALVAQHRYAVVIADLRLSGVCGTEGLEIVRYVREHCPRTRTVLLTAHGSEELRAEARRRGVDLVLLKPKPLSDLIQIILGLIESPGAQP